MNIFLEKKGKYFKENRIELIRLKALKEGFLIITLKKNAFLMKGIFLC